MGHLVKLTALVVIVILFLQALFGIIMGARRFITGTMEGVPAQTIGESVSYKPGSTESYVFQHVHALGYNSTSNPAAAIPDHHRNRQVSAVGANSARPLAISPPKGIHVATRAAAMGR